MNRTFLLAALLLAPLSRSKSRALSQNPDARPLRQRLPRRDAGQGKSPEAPGLGIEWDWKAIAKLRTDAPAVIGRKAPDSTRRRKG